MSASNELSKRTRVLVKDLIFQEQYKLTDKQTDLMSYISNALTWALNINGFMPLTNKKFAQDLPQMGTSSLEANLRELKNMELIEVEMIKVPQWNNATVRGIKITAKGLEYNNHFIKPDEKKVIQVLQEQIELDRLKIQELEAKLKSPSKSPENSNPPKTKELKEIEKSKEEKKETTTVQKPLDIEKIKDELKAEIVPEIREVIQQTLLSLQKPEEIKEEEESKNEEIKKEEFNEEEFNREDYDIELDINMPENREIREHDIVNRDDLDELVRVKEVEIRKEEGSKYKGLSLSDFIEVVTRDFGITSAPICNYVNNGDWLKGTIFNINSYKKISVTSSQGENYQLKDPNYIHRFWLWLYKNQHRIGDVINYSAKPSIQTLNIRYRGATLKINHNGDDCLYKFKEVVDAGPNLVKIEIIEPKNNQIATLLFEGGRKTGDTYEADSLIFKYLV